MMPFPGGVEATANATLIFSIVAAVLYAAMLQRAPSWRRTLAKTGSVALLAVLAGVENGPLLLVVALVLSAVGDALLSRDGERAFMAGLASFLVAHIVYVALFVTAGAGIAAFGAEPWRIVVGLLMLAFSVAIYLRLRLALPRGLMLPVTIYVSAILAMGLSSLTLDRPMVIAGAVLFMVSDAILAAGRFLMAPASPRQPLAGMIVWTLYFAAQVMIALGFLVE